MKPGENSQRLRLLDNGQLSSSGWNVSGLEHLEVNGNTAVKGGENPRAQKAARSVGVFRMNRNVQ